MRKFQKIATIKYSDDKREIARLLDLGYKEIKKPKPKKKAAAKKKTEKKGK